MTIWQKKSMEYNKFVINNQNNTTLFDATLNHVSADGEELKASISKEHRRSFSEAAKKAQAAKKALQQVIEEFFFSGLQAAILASQPQAQIPAEYPPPEPEEPRPVADVR